MRISWDSTDPVYSSGVSQGVFYPQNSPGVPWNGLISVLEKGDASQTSLYLDGQKYRNQVPAGNFAGTISAFTYPDEFEPYNGQVSSVMGQPRTSFGFSYQTNNELHLVYNAMVSPSNDQYVSLGDTATPVSFQWNFTTLPIDISETRPSAHIVVLLDYVNANALSDLQAIIYGDDSDDPSLPDPSIVYGIFESYTTVTITDNGDGTWTASGPDSTVSMLDANTFEIDWASAIFINSTSYTVRSL
jgi:hypothetical protein